MRGIFQKPGASCCREAYWLEAPGETEEIPGVVIWTLRAISSCLMLALFVLFPLCSLARAFTISLPRLSGVYPPRPGAQTVDTNEIAAFLVRVGL